MKRKIDIIALIILITSAVNCGIIGIFGFNVFAWLFDGRIVLANRIIYVIVALAGFWCINLIVVQKQKKDEACLDDKCAEDL